MKLSLSRDGDEESPNTRSVKRTDRRLSNCLTVELWLWVSQARKGKKLLRDVNTWNRDAFVTYFEQEQYQVGFVMLLVTFESQDVEGKYTDISQLRREEMDRVLLKSNKKLCFE